MKNIITLIILFTLFNVPEVKAQKGDLDSLHNLLTHDLADTSEINILNSIAFSYLLTNPSIGMDDVNIAFKKSVEIDYKAGEANSLNIKGALNWALSNYPEALNNYFEAIDIYESLNNQIEIAKCYNNIGEIYKKTNELDKALEYLNNSLKLLQQYADTNETLLIYTNIAEVFVMQDSLEKAENYYTQVLESQDVPSQYLAYANMGLGRIAEKRANLGEAEKYLLNALKIRRKEKDNRGVIDAYVAIGNLLKNKSNYDSSQYYYKQAIIHAKDISAKDLLMKAYMGKVIVDSLKADYKSAFHNYLKYSQLKDSTFNNEKSEQIARLQTVYETEILKAENLANQIKVRQQSSLITFIIVALILAVTVAIALYRQRKSQLRANRLLTEKNEKIERQSYELEILNKNLKELNESLEEKIRKRTQKLTEQNAVLSEYAYTNAHDLRAPVANILGLISLLKKSEISKEEEEIVEHLKEAGAKLDLVIQEMRAKLEKAEGRD